MAPTAAPPRVACRVPRRRSPGARGSFRRRLVLTLVALVAAIPATPATAVAYTVSSPGGLLTAHVAVEAGRGQLEVLRAGRVVLSTPLGPVGTRRPRLRRFHDVQRYATPAGKRREHLLDADCLSLRFSAGQTVQVLAADDGVAFRRAGAPPDPTIWQTRAGSRVWLARLTSNYETEYQPTTLSAAAAGRYGFPALLNPRAGTWVLLTEAGIPYGQPAAHLAISGHHPGQLAVELPRGERAARGAGPWRVAVIGSLANIVASDLPLSLGAPSRIADTSWIRPGRAAWSWWSDSWSPRRLDSQKQYVDFAAEEGFEYVIVDAGWDAAWVPELAAYAAGKSVRVVLWTDWHQLERPTQRRRLLARWASWGVAGVKVDFLQSDRGGRMAILEDIARDAAARRMVVDFHGCTLPRGLQRTWPNVLTMEAVLGAEHAKGDGVVSPAHDVNLTFIRNPVGSMDYTPVTFSSRHRASSAGHELAQAIAFESGLQDYADSPDSYRSQPAALKLLRTVPAAWDDTVLAAGEPDSYSVLARRAGRDWYVGALAAGPARTIAAPLEFLARGTLYRARVYADQGHDGLQVSEQLVGAGDTLRVQVADNGGFAVDLSPLLARPVRPPMLEGDRGG